MRKITEILKKPGKEDNIILDVLVKDGKAVMLEETLIPGFEKGCEKFSFELANPSFEVISQACASLYTVGGQFDAVGAGKVVFDSCYLGNQGTLEEIQQIAYLYAALCAKCSDKAELAYVDYKKK